MTDLMQVMIEQIKLLERRIGALERLEYTQGGGAGSGDMLKSVYDTNNDGTVNSAVDADTVDSQHAAAFAVAAKGVTNGDSHDHAGGDGAQVDHGGLGGLADDDHSQYYNSTRGDARYALTAKGVTNGDSHDHAGGDGGQVDHGGLGGLSDDDHSQYLKANGTRELSADWDAGPYEIRSGTFESDIPNGTAPLTVNSNTKVTNFNADLLDGSEGLAFAKYTAVTVTALIDSAANTWNGAARNTGDYTFRPSDNSTIWPATAKAVILQIGARWASANQNYYLSVKRSSGGTAEMVTRSQVASINTNIQGIQCLDGSGYFYATVSGANADAIGMYIVGYIA
jgi:hypothetical protein